MASRKRLKKNVRHICGEMLYVCGLSYAEKGQLTPEIQTAVQEVIRLQADIVCRISHTERGSVKLFYRQLREDFAKGIEQAYTTLVNA